MATAPKKKRIEVLRYDVDAARAVVEAEFGSSSKIVRPPVSLSAAGKASFIRYGFNHSLRISIKHGMNTDRFIATLKDLDGVQFFARIQIVDKNEFVVYLTESISGFVDVIFDAAATEVIYV